MYFNFVILPDYLSMFFSFLLSLLNFIGVVLIYLVAGFLSMCLAIYFHKKELNVPPRLKLESSQQLLQKTNERIQEYKFPPRKLMKHTSLISRNVDDVIDELINLLLRDYVNSWYANLVDEYGVFINDLKPLIREILFTFRDRCQKIDNVQLITYDFVNILCKHMQNVKNAAINPPDKVQPYRVYPFLEKEEDEMKYLRVVTEFLLITLLPKKYAKVKPVRHLLREIFAISVFYNLINKLLDPDSINQRLIAHLEHQQKAAEKHGRLYAYAETYEDFIKLIQECGSIEALHRMRYYIISEIMEATKMKDVKRSKGMDVDKEFATQRTGKGDLLQSRNLSQYLNQLRYAKGQCEKRVKLLGGPDFITSPHGSFDSSFEEKMGIPGRKVLSMSVIIQSAFCRHHFSKFLQKEEMHSLLAFWEAVGEMKHSDKIVWHQLGNDIVRMYINNQASAVRLSKNTRKGIEEFMMANKGPDAFFQAQEEVYKHLEENSYASFIVSDIYHKMLAEAEKQGIDFAQRLTDSDQESEAKNAASAKAEELDILLFDHSSYARTQLKSLQEKLNDKIQAVSALRSNPKGDTKAIIAKLDKEIEDLCLEQRMLENHIEKTELWIRYLGLWQATVMQATIAKENDKNVPFFNVMVHLSNDIHHQSRKSVGWVISRNLNSFHSLHQKLVPAAVWLKKIDLPTKPRFKSLDKAYLEKMKLSLQTFLSAVTKDDGLNKSEALYSFLSPSPEHMKHPAYPMKKPMRFSLMQFLKGVQNTLGQADDAEEEELLFLDDIDSKEDKKDSIAEPLYALIGEIFEEKGVFSWLRRTLVIFVQLAYGRTINRQLRESVSYITSEPMLLSYLQMFRDSMWPTGQTMSPAPQPERTANEQLETKYAAKKMILSSIPELLNNLLGQQNAKKGVTKLFDALQDKTLNKQLFYNILEAFLYAYAPELKQSSNSRPSVMRTIFEHIPDL